jgi:hypothetical protein
VREYLPDGDFSIMTEMLKKFLSFMNLTVSSFYCSSYEQFKIQKKFILAHNFRGFNPSWQGEHIGAKQLTSWQSRKEGEEMSVLVGFFLFCLFILSGPLACGVVLPTFKVDYLPLSYRLSPPPVSPFWKH